MCAHETNTASETAGRAAAPAESPAQLTQDTRTHRRPDGTSRGSPGKPAAVAFIASALVSKFMCKDGRSPGLGLLRCHLLEPEELHTG